MRGAKLKIYTKTGDQGTTKLVTGNTVFKSNPQVSAYGDVDETNSVIGLIIAELELSVHKLKQGFDSNLEINKDQPTPERLNQDLIIIQKRLFTVGSLLACDKEDTLSMLPRLTAKEIESLENSIDLFSEKLPALKNFILPGGSTIGAHFHIARTVCRRAERSVSEIIQIEKSNKVAESILGCHLNCLIYLNRLSDLLFVYARWINFIFKSEEKIWTPE